MTIPENYTVDDSPYHDAIIDIIKKLHDEGLKLKSSDDRNSVSNALYCAVVKRMSQRKYDAHSSDYLSALIDDVSEGKREFFEVCYDNNYAEDVFRSLRLNLLMLMSSS